MMTKRKNTGAVRRERHISVRAVRRSQPDVKRLSKTLITYALEQAAAEAAAERDAAQQTGKGRRRA